MDKRCFIEFEMVYNWKYEDEFVPKTKKVVIDVLKIVSFEQCEDDEKCVDVVLENRSRYTIYGNDLITLTNKICNVADVFLQQDD